MHVDDCRSAPNLSRLDALAGLATVFVAGMIVWVWACYGRYLWQALHYPYGLDYSEGLIWQQVLWLGGPHMYGDISHYPFVVYVYPPLYLLCVRALTAADIGMLAAGRGLSIVSTLALCCLLGLVVWRACRPMARPLSAGIAAAMAASLPATLLPVISWSVLMRVDMLALALTYAGLALGTYALRRPRLLYPAVLAFVAAVFTKQIYLAAPVSLAAVMLVRSPGVAVRAFALGAAVGLALVAWLSWITDGGFVRHIFLYNVDRVNVSAALRQVADWLAAYPILAALVVASVWLAWRRMLMRQNLAGLGGLAAAIRGDEWAAFLMLMTIYLVLTTAMLVSAGKIGASRNYFLEWMSVWCVWIGLLAARIADTYDSAAHSKVLLRAVRLGLSTALFLQIFALPHAIDMLRTTQLSSEHRMQAASLLERVKALPEPVLSDDMVLLMQTGHELGIEPGIMLELAGTGVWDERKLIGMLADRRFSAVITAYDPGDPTFNARYLPATQAAMLANYPVIQRFGDYRLRVPVSIQGAR